MMLSSRALLVIDVLLLAIGVVVALRRGPLFASRGLRRAAVIAALALAVFSYTDGGRFVRGHFLNLHDLFHYYFSAKYAPELGYRRLYHCTVVGLDEIDPKLHAGVSQVRSMVHYRRVAKEWFLARPDGCKRHFSPLRWQAWKRDLERFRNDLRGNFAPSLLDKGFNATPLWTWLAHPIANATRLEPGFRLNALGALDLALLAAALAAIGRAFGGRSAFLVAIYLAGCWELSEPHVRGGFLRLDWLACSLLAVACVERKRPVAAGALLAWASGVRVVPVLLIAVVAMRTLHDLLRGAAVPRATRRLLGSFAVSCVLLFALSLTGAAGPHAWRDFAEKIAVHDADVSPLRVGAKALATWRGETGPEDYVGAHGEPGYRPHFVAAKRALYAQWRFVLLALALLVAMGLASWLPPGDDAAAIALSFPIVFLLATPTFYYYVLLAIPVAVLAARTDTRWGRWGLASLFAAAIAVHGVRHFFGFAFLANALHSAVIALLCIVVLALVALTRSRAPATAPAGAA